MVLDTHFTLADVTTRQGTSLAQLDVHSPDPRTNGPLTNHVDASFQLEYTPRTGESVRPRSL